MAKATGRFVVLLLFNNKTPLKNSSNNKITLYTQARLHQGALMTASSTKDTGHIDQTDTENGSYKSHARSRAVATTQFARIVASNAIESHGFLANLVLSRDLVKSLFSASSVENNKSMSVENLNASASFGHFYSQRFKLFARVAIQVVKAFTKPDLSYENVADIASLTIFAHSEFGEEKNVDRSTEKSTCAVVTKQASSTATLRLKLPSSSFEGAQRFVDHFLKVFRTECGDSAQSCETHTSDSSNITKCGATVTGQNGLDSNIDAAEDSLTLRGNTDCEAEAVDNKDGQVKSSSSAKTTNNSYEVFLSRLLRAVHTWWEILDNNKCMSEELIFQVSRPRLLRVCNTLYNTLHQRSNTIEGCK